MYIMRYIVACVVWTYKVRALSLDLMHKTARVNMDQYTQSEIYDEYELAFRQIRRQLENKYSLKLSHSEFFFDYDYDDIEDYGDALFTRRWKLYRLNDYDNRNVTFVI